MEEDVYEYLCLNCLGKENLIKNRVLRELFDIKSDRSMRKIIQNIRENKKFPNLVGSVAGIKGGFYICVNRREKEETIKSIKHRANQMLKMTHILEWKAGLE